MTMTMTTTNKPSTKSSNRNCGGGSDKRVGIKKLSRASLWALPNFSDDKSVDSLDLLSEHIKGLNTGHSSSSVCSIGSNTVGDSASASPNNNKNNNSNNNGRYSRKSSREANKSTTKLKLTREISNEAADRVDMPNLDDVLRNADAAAGRGIGKGHRDGAAVEMSIRTYQSVSTESSKCGGGGTVGAIIIMEQEESSPVQPVTPQPQLIRHDENEKSSESNEQCNRDSLDNDTGISDGNNNTSNNDRPKQRMNIFRNLFGRRGKSKGNSDSRRGAMDRDFVSFDDTSTIITKHEESLYAPTPQTTSRKKQRCKRRSSKNLRIFGGALDGDYCDDDASFLDYTDYYNISTDRDQNSKGRGSKSSRSSRSSKSKRGNRNGNGNGLRSLFSRGGKFVRKHAVLLKLLTVLASLGLAVTTGVFVLAITP